MTFDDIVYEQYEQVRAAGPCNMWDAVCVSDYAETRGFDDLAYVATELDQYAVLIREFVEWLEGTG